MAFAFVQDIPSDWDTYEKLVAELGVDAAPPAGLIVHTAGRSADGIRVIDVWESEAAHEAFATERLAPARTKVLGPGAAVATPAQKLDVQHVVRG